MAQSAILAKRNQEWIQNFYPQIIQGIFGAEQPGAETSMFDQASSDINQQFKQGEKKLGMSMQSRGLAGSGMETLAMAGYENARTSALADAMAKAETENTNRRNQYMQLALGMAPMPTSAVPMGYKGSSESMSASYKYKPQKETPKVD
jgi:hypothetical protein